MAIGKLSKRVKPGRWSDIFRKKEDLKNRKVVLEVTPPALRSVTRSVSVVGTEASRSFVAHRLQFVLVLRNRGNDTIFYCTILGLFPTADIWDVVLCFFVFLFL